MGESCNYHIATSTCRGITSSNGLNLKIYSSNSFGNSLKFVILETTPSKVAELQSGE